MNTPGVVWCLAMVGLLRVGTFDAGAAESGPVPGKSLALSTCAYCHIVGPDQAFTPPLSPQGPTFSGIAADQKFSAKKLRFFLKTTHRDIAHGKEMPNPVLSNGQIDDIVTYISSLH